MAGFLTHTVYYEKQQSKHSILLFQLKLWPTLSEEKQTILMKQEENAIMNQLLLFVQRIINLRIPVEFTEGAQICLYDNVIYNMFLCIHEQSYSLSLSLSLSLLTLSLSLQVRKSRRGLSLS